MQACIINFSFLQTCSSSKVHYRFAMYSISVLVNCSSLHSFQRCIETCKRAFCSKYADEQALAAIEKLKSWFDELPGDFVDDDDENADDDDVDSVTGEEGSDDIFSSKEELHLTSKTWKPFGAFFNLKLDKVALHCDSTTAALNPLYKPELVDKLIRNWLPTAPFWSSMLRGDDHI